MNHLNNDLESNAYSLISDSFMPIKTMTVDIEVDRKELTWKSFSL